MIIYATERYYDELKKKCDINEEYNKLKGIEGEEQVFHFLKPLATKYDGFIIPNFRFGYNGENVEVDFLVVIKNSIIILEVKNWANPVDISTLGSVITSDNQTRINVEFQLKRQKWALEDIIKKEFDTDLDIDFCVLFSNLARHTNLSSVNIIDYSSVLSEIERIISNNPPIELDFERLQDFLFRKNINEDINREYYFNKSETSLRIIKGDNESLAPKKDSLVKRDLSSYDTYFFMPLREKSGIVGKSYKICIPKELKFPLNRYDDRGFALLYNLLVRGDSSLFPKKYIEEIERKRIKSEVHYSILITLLLIKNGFFQKRGNAFNIPINCDDEDIITYSKIIIEYWLDLLSSISDIDEYTINYDGKERKIIFDDNIIKGAIYVELIDKQLGKNKDDKQFERDIWISGTINYSIENNIDALNELVDTLFGFTEYRDGQLECIQSIFGNDSNQIIMLPTGQGKSMIFYLLLLLQPKIGIIVYPTSLLMNDQIIKLNSFHVKNINNFSDTKQIDFSHIQMMKPEDILDKNILEKFISINQKNTISYLILDEVHCLSKFSHDFRPEYFLMHDKINYYLDKTVVKGFTATATWEVLEDLKDQFGISETDIISPKLSKHNVEYLIKYIEKDKRVSALKNDIENIRNKYRNEDKLLVFSNNPQDIKAIENKLNLDGVVYALGVDDYMEMESFLTPHGNDVLIALNDIGIGVDIDNLNTIIHYTQPLSIADFSQHTGRGGRKDYSCTSIVYYGDEEYQLENEIKDIKKLIESIYKELLVCSEKGYNWAEIKVNSKNINDIKFAFFSFYQLGVISEWWKQSENSFGLGINREYNLDFQLIKRHVFRDMSNERSLIQKIVNADSIVELVEGYYNWFIEWNKTFKANSYIIMKKLLDRIVVEKLNNDKIQSIITSETYYSNLEIVEVSRIKTMSFGDIIKFAEDSNNELSTYQKYFNSTNPKLNFLSVLNDLKSNTRINVVIRNLNRCISLLTKDEKILLVKSLLASKYIINNVEIIETIYVDIYRDLDTMNKRSIFEIVEKTNINNSLKYLFFLSLVNDSLSEVTYG